MEFLRHVSENDAGCISVNSPVVLVRRLVPVAAFRFVTSWRGPCARQEGAENYTRTHRLHNEVRNCCILRRTLRGAHIPHECCLLRIGQGSEISEAYRQIVKLFLIHYFEKDTSIKLCLETC